MGESILTVPVVTYRFQNFCSIFTPEFYASWAIPLGVNLIWYLRLPISVRFERWHRFRTVRYLGYRPSQAHIAVPSVLHHVGMTPHAVCCVCCVLCTVYSVSSVLCVVCCVCCVLCRLCVTNPCVSVIKFGYFGNLFGNLLNDLPFYWLISTA